MALDSRHFNDHDYFRELCAVSMSGLLTDQETAALLAHTRECGDCHLLQQQYHILAKEGMPMLAVRYGHAEEVSWEDSDARQKVLDRAATLEPDHVASISKSSRVFVLPNPLRLRIIKKFPWRTAAAACLIAALSSAFYFTGRRKQDSMKQANASMETRLHALEKEKRAADDSLALATQKLNQTAVSAAEKQRDLEKLQAAYDALAHRSDDLAIAKATTDDQLRTVAQQRETLAKQLQLAQQSYDGAQTELQRLLADHDQEIIHSASLQRQVADLTASNHELQRRSDTDAQFLSSDRDIRELMGARQLYIADVFDVSSDSHTRKPYGRIFYTKGKSLIFYAFDLDKQPIPKSSAAFQAWGKNGEEQVRPVNLGILYKDSDANRRWILRCDDSQQLKQIDAVFVTVEPHGGSAQPTGKPFLVASLRKEANHP